MKKLVLLAMALGFGLYAGAQKISASKVSVAAKTAFLKAQPTVKNPSWEKEDGNFEGNWKAGGMDHSVTYTPGGKFAGSETDISPAKLPQGARDYVQQKVHSAIKEASLNEDAQGKKTYEADVKGKAYIFDTEGHFLKTGEDD